MDNVKKNKQDFVIQGNEHNSFSTIETDHEHPDILTRLQQDPATLKPLLIKLLDHIRELYKEFLPERVIQVYYVALETESYVLYQAIFIFLIAIESTIKNCIIDYYKKIEYKDMKLLSAFINSTEPACRHLLSCAYNKNNSMNFMKQFSEFFMISWVTKNEKELKKFAPMPL